MLTVSHLRASYGERLVLQDINLTIDSDELVVVLGPSGCGKTTLLNLIAGFIPADGGSITLDGQPVSGPGADRGVVFQHEGLLPWRNVLDNVAFGLQLAGVEKSERRAVAQRMLKKPGCRGLSTILSGSFPAACASAWALPERWRQIRACCCWMNPLARWTRLPANRCRNCCCGCGVTVANRSC